MQIRGDTPLPSDAPNPPLDSGLMVRRVPCVLVEDVLCDNVRVIRRLLVKLKAVLDIVGKSDSGDLMQLSLTPLLSWRRTPSATLTFFLEMPTESVSV